MGATRRSLQVQHTILKKSSKHQIYQSERKFSQKKLCFQPKKCKGAKNSYGGYPTEFAGTTQIPKIIIETQNQDKILSKKVCLVP
jgi:hypothetical protein